MLRIPRMDRHHQQCLRSFVALLVLLTSVSVEANDKRSSKSGQQRYHIVDHAIPQPLSSTPGDAKRGKAVLEDQERGNCLVCHMTPRGDRHMQGTVGPPLDGVANRVSLATLRLRIVDSQAFAPMSVMPSYHRTHDLHRVDGRYVNQTILTQQEVEDILAYLVTMTETPAEVPSPLSSPTTASQTSPRGNPPRSGFTYLSPESQQLQDDEFANPGMLWVERGRELWNTADGTTGVACATCHANAATSMKGVRPRYPRYSKQRRKLVNLEQQINWCRVTRIQAPAFEYESEPLLALATFISFQSRHLPMQVAVDGPARRFFAAGRTSFARRRGQLNLACGHCHDHNSGKRLRGEIISQGQTNGFPIYRQLWQTLGSSHRMFAWCNTAIRAKPFALGSDEYVNLELYMAWRARGLPVESPAIRR